MKRIIIILALVLVSVIRNDAHSQFCNNSIDSLFKKNCIELRALVSKPTSSVKFLGNKIVSDSIIDSSKNVNVLNFENAHFLYATSFLSGKEFEGNPHDVTINIKTILEMEKWYQQKRKFLTPEIVKKAYRLACLCPGFRNQDELNQYQKEFDEELYQLKIKDK